MVNQTQAPSIHSLRECLEIATLLIVWNVFKSNEIGNNINIIVFMCFSVVNPLRSVTQVWIINILSFVALFFGSLCNNLNTKSFT